MGSHAIRRKRIQMAIGSAMLKAMISVESSGNSTSGLAYPTSREAVLKRWEYARLG